MPLTEEQKLRKKAYKKQYYIDNKHKVKEKCKEWYVNNKQTAIDRAKEWKKNNPEKVKICNQKWWQNNLEKSNIYSWKKNIIICDDYNLIYRIYVDTNKCEFCQTEFKNSYDRCLDHNHSILDSYNIRGILCRQCNFKDVLKGFPIKIYTDICEWK